MVPEMEQDGQADNSHCLSIGLDIFQHFNNQSDQLWSFPGRSVVKNPPPMQEIQFIPGTGRCPGEGNGNPLQDSHPGNPKDREAWWAAVHGSERVGHNLATKQDQLYHLTVSPTSKPGTLLIPDASFQRVYEFSF